MNTTTTKIAGEAMTNERATFKEFRAALCRMNYANTPVSVADRVMILSNATFLMDEYVRGLLASPSDVPPCAHVNNPKGCYRVRCQLGNKCVDDDMSPRSAPTAPAQSCGDAEQADEAVTLPIMRAAFRVVETEGDPDPDKQRFHLRFTFRSMRELDAACDEWRAFSNAARAKDSK